MRQSPSLQDLFRLAILGLVLAAALPLPARSAEDFHPLEPQSRLPRATAFAEDVYAELAATSGGALDIEIETLDGAALEEIRGEKFADLLEIPSYRLVATLSADALHDPRFVDVPAGTARLPELGASVEKFDKIDYPLVLGRYRKLQVTVSLGGEQKAHQALEFCWEELEHCALLDPVFLHAQSMVDNRLRLAAEGWAPKIMVEKVTAESPRRACRLAGHPDWISYTRRFEGFEIEHKDLFGEPVLSATLGTMEIGVRCAGDSQESCAPVFFEGESAASSCESHHPAFPCGPCEATFETATGTASASTGCVHGLGESVRTVTRNGGVLDELCTWSEP